MPRKFNIGFFSDTFTPQINGVVTSLQIFWKELERQGHNVYIFAPTPKLKNDTKNIFRLPSLPFIFQPEMRFALPYSWQIDKKISALNLDIVHAHTPFSLGLFAKHIAQENNLPFIQTFHTLYPEYLHYILGPAAKNPLAQYGAKKIITFLYNRSDLIIVPSEKIKNYLRKCEIRKQIVVISTGIDLENFKNIDGNSFRRKYNISFKDKLLVSIGRLGKEKNLEFLIKVLTKIPNENIKLLLVGDGPEKENIKKLAQKLNLKNRIIFTGYVPRKIIPQLLSTADIFIFASKTETQGLVLLEAAAAQKPIIALADAVVKEFVQDNVNGFITPASPSLFANKIEELLNNEKLYYKFSQASLRIAQKFSATNQTKKLLEVYQKLI